MNRIDGSSLNKQTDLVVLSEEGVTALEGASRKKCATSYRHNVNVFIE